MSTIPYEWTFQQRAAWDRKGSLEEEKGGFSALRPPPPSLLHTCMLRYWAVRENPYQPNVPKQWKTFLVWLPTPSQLASTTWDQEAQRLLAYVQGPSGVRSTDAFIYIKTFAQFQSTFPFEKLYPSYSARATVQQWNQDTTVKEEKGRPLPCVLFVLDLATLVKPLADVHIEQSPYALHRILELLHEQGLLPTKTPGPFQPSGNLYYHRFMMDLIDLWMDFRVYSWFSRDLQRNQKECRFMETLVWKLDPTVAEDFQSMTTFVVLPPEEKSKSNATRTSTSAFVDEWVSILEAAFHRDTDVPATLRQGQSLVTVPSLDALVEALEDHFYTFRSLFKTLLFHRSVTVFVLFDVRPERGLTTWYYEWIEAWQLFRQKEKATASLYKSLHEGFYTPFPSLFDPQQYLPYMEIGFFSAPPNSFLSNLQKGWKDYTSTFQGAFHDPTFQGGVTSFVYFDMAPNSTLFYHEMQRASQFMVNPVRALDATTFMIQTYGAKGDFPFNGTVDRLYEIRLNALSPSPRLLKPPSPLAKPLKAPLRPLTSVKIPVKTIHPSPLAPAAPLFTTPLQNPKQSASASIFTTQTWAQVLKAQTEGPTKVFTRAALQAVDCGGGGDCLFYSLATFLFNVVGTQEHEVLSQLLRRIAVTYLMHYFGRERPPYKSFKVYEEDPEPLFFSTETEQLQWQQRQQKKRSDFLQQEKDDLDLITAHMCTSALNDAVEEYDEERESDLSTYRTWRTMLIKKLGFPPTITEAEETQFLKETLQVDKKTGVPNLNDLFACHLAKMCNTPFWASHVEMFALSQVFGMQMYVLDNQNHWSVPFAGMPYASHPPASYPFTPDAKDIMLIGPVRGQARAYSDTVHYIWIRVAWESSIFTDAERAQAALDAQTRRTKNLNIVRDQYAQEWKDYQQGPFPKLGYPVIRRTLSVGTQCRMIEEQWYDRIRKRQAPKRPKPTTTASSTTPLEVIVIDDKAMRPGYKRNEPDMPTPPPSNEDKKINRRVRVQLEIVDLKLETEVEVATSFTYVGEVMLFLLQWVLEHPVEAFTPMDLLRARLERASDLPFYKKEIWDRLHQHQFKPWQEALPWFYLSHDIYTYSSLWKSVYDHETPVSIALSAVVPHERALRLHENRWIKFVSTAGRSMEWILLHMLPPDPSPVGGTRASSLVTQEPREEKDIDPLWKRDRNYYDVKEPVAPTENWVPYMDRAHLWRHSFLQWLLLFEASRQIVATHVEKVEVVPPPVFPDDITYQYRPRGLEHPEYARALNALLAWKYNHFAWIRVQFELGMPSSALPLAQLLESKSQEGDLIYGAFELLRGPVSVQTPVSSSSSSPSSSTSIALKQAEFIVERAETLQACFTSPIFSRPTAPFAVLFRGISTRESLGLRLGHVKHMKSPLATSWNVHAALAFSNLRMEASVMVRHPTTRYYREVYPMSIYYLEVPVPVVYLTPFLPTSSPEQYEILLPPNLQYEVIEIEDVWISLVRTPSIQVLYRLFHTLVRPVTASSIASKECATCGGRFDPGVVEKGCATCGGRFKEEIIIEKACATCGGQMKALMVEKACGVCGGTNVS